MSLTKQIHLYSIDTSAFYEGQELTIHKRLLKLYKLRKAKGILPWKKKSVNRVIKKHKEKLTALLDARLKDSTPRELNVADLTPKNVISLFESSLTRALGINTNELTTDLFILNVYFFQVFENLVKDGFLYNNERYVFLTASAGQIRTKKAVFIRETVYERIQPRIMCGLTIRDINDAGGINTNKFLAYLALTNSATDVWKDFDIDKSIVVDDFETNVRGLVDYIDSGTYDITRREMDVPINHVDGCGMINSGPTRMARLAWVKGLMVHFPFRDFIKEKCPDGECVVYDIYGMQHKIIEEDIQYIFTKSQFKLH